MNCRIIAIGLATLTLSACVGSGGVVPPAQRSQPPVARQNPMTNIVGLEQVMGQDERGLVRLFGDPRLDIREGDARKLQFTGDACVLDTYLYPEGSREPVVTYVDARTPDGRTADRASCVAALRRR